ncbi:MAG TPA: hypothetical protein V6C81_28085 [Planktothrix sp.]
MEISESATGSEFQALDEVQMCRRAAEVTLDADELAIFASHSSVKVRTYLASNPGLTEPIIWQLASDTEPRVRQKLAANRHLPMFILESLCEDEHPAVAASAERTIKSLNKGDSLGEVVFAFFNKDFRQAG